MRVEGLYSSFSPSFEPLTYRPLADSQCDRNVFLLPAFLFQLPRSFASFCSPIGFLWCSHTSYSITLYFSLPTSVKFTLHYRGHCGFICLCCMFHCLPQFVNA